MNRTSLGFTLLELLITVAIAAILVGIGVPSYKSFIQSNRLETATNRLQGSLKYARDEAITQGSVITLERKSADDNEWSEGWTIYTDSDSAGNSSFGGADEMLKNFDALGGDLKIVGSDSADRWISFRPSGQLNEGGNTVELRLCDSRGATAGKLISVTRVGHTSVREADNCE